MSPPPGPGPILVGIVVSTLLLFSTSLAPAVLVLWGLITAALLLAPVLSLAAPLVAIGGAVTLVWASAGTLDALAWLVWWLWSGLALVFTVLMGVGRWMERRRGKEHG